MVPNIRWQGIPDRYLVARESCENHIALLKGSLLKSDTLAVLAVLPRYWGRNTRDCRGDGDQACGTTAVMRLGFSRVRVIL